MTTTTQATAGQPLQRPVTTATIAKTESRTPLVVDMDGCLLRTDVLFEAIASGLARDCDRNGRPDSCDF